jgi:hypothetical protein
MGPYAVVADWNGPLLWAMNKYTPDALNAINNFKYFV